MYIDIEKITPRQKLIIARGLCDYEYILHNWKSNDADFQDVYYDFYLKARWAVMSKPNNKFPYFMKLQSISPEDSLMDILDSLKKEMENHSFELSLGSKLLHTRNPATPIYDSKVKSYLSKEENVEFWWHRTSDMSGLPAPRGTPERTKIEHDWMMLCEWYDAFLLSPRGNQWINWFDLNFPNHKYISNVKKIDFIIFATN